MNANTYEMIKDTLRDEATVMFAEAIKMGSEKFFVNGLLQTAGVDYTGDILQGFTFQGPALELIQGGASFVAYGISDRVATMDGVEGKKGAFDRLGAGAGFAVDFASTSDVAIRQDRG